MTRKIAVLSQSIVDELNHSKSDKESFKLINDKLHMLLIEKSFKLTIKEKIVYLLHKGLNTDEIVKITGFERGYVLYHFRNYKDYFSTDAEEFWNPEKEMS